MFSSTRPPTPLSSTTSPHRTHLSLSLSILWCTTVGAPSLPWHTTADGSLPPLPHGFGPAARGRLDPAAARIHSKEAQGGGAGTDPRQAPPLLTPSLAVPPWIHDRSVAAAGAGRFPRSPSPSLPLPHNLPYANLVQDPQEGEPWRAS
jgi:hypothetical protein